MGFSLRQAANNCEENGSTTQKHNQSLWFQNEKEGPDG
jgi:hypothetical protein